MRKKCITSLRLICLLLAICMLAICMLATMLAGYGKAPSKVENGDGQMRHYVESTLTSLDSVNRVLGIFRDTNGNIVFYAVKGEGTKSSIRVFTIHVGFSGLKKLDINRTNVYYRTYEK